MTGKITIPSVRKSFVVAALLTFALSLVILATSLSSAYAQETEPTVDPASYAGLAPLTNIKAIAMGGYHTCALTTAGGVKCWGRDLDGQVGDGADTGNKNTPVDVTGLTSGVQAITAGWYHTCALTTGGGVKCWGSDDEGQLGDDPLIIGKHTPVDVQGLGSGIKAIAAGGYHTCALTTGGGVKCWGYDSSGQIGDGNNNSDKPTPVDVVGLASGVQSIAGGLNSTCAVVTGGAVKCWGYGGYGQLANGGTLPNAPSSNVPTDAIGLTSGVLQIRGGSNHFCALITGGSVKCWGNGTSGQLGDGLAADTSTPVDVTGFGGGAQAIATGGDHSCALTTSGAMKCWGHGYSGQLGFGPLSSVSSENIKRTQVDVVGLSSGVQAIAAFAQQTCALMIGGRVKCWGYDGYGQIGDGDYAPDKTSPVDVLVPVTCFRLTLARSGSGATPVVASGASSECQQGHYLRGSTILLQAAPAANQRVQAWSAPVVGGAGALLASLAMPAADTTVTVTYAPCYALSRTHSGAGGNPTASPAQSLGCAAGRFAQGESIVLTALPNANQRVKAWSGATGTPAVGSQVNSVTMPNADKTVSVAYEACLALALSKSGEGAAPVASPDVSDGCLTGGFAAGEQIMLQANPAPGWRVARWTGTSNNASRNATNTVVMQEGATVGVIYESAVFLPSIGR